MSSNLCFRIRDGIEPMTLCHLCLSLNIDTLPQDNNTRIAHYNRFSELKESAENCGMCGLFLDATLDDLCDTIRQMDRFCQLPRAHLQAVAHTLFNNAETQAINRVQCFIETFRAQIGLTHITYSIAAYYEGSEVYPHYENTAIGTFALRNCGNSRNPELPFIEIGPLPNWDLARGWIDDCRNNHARCSPRFLYGTGVKEIGVLRESEANDLSVAAEPRVALPARLLHVGDGVNEPRLALDVSLDTEYATLSHCWGKVQLTTTIKSNLDQHLVSIPLSVMSRTFRDAVVATRELKLQYVWIDSLCIVQDSKDDWETESAKMASIYMRSVITICGPKATDSSCGFLNRRTCPPHAQRTHIWNYRNPGDHTIQQATLTRCPDNEVNSKDFPDSRGLSEVEDASTVGSRGWILQEGTLSTRTLYFGLYRMYWKCAHLTRFEDVQPGEHETWQETLHNSLTASQMSGTDKDGTTVPVNVSSNWCRAVGWYTARSLTKATDKLPAIGGIADWLLGGRSENYAAGLLRLDMRKGLSWYVWDPDRLVPAVEDYRAPSWSWASNDYVVRFVGEDLPSGDVISEASKQEHENASAEYGIQVHDISVTLKGMNPYGEVTGAVLKLVGVIQTSSVLRICASQRKAHPEINHYKRDVFQPILLTRHPAFKRVGLFYPDQPEKWGHFSNDVDEDYEPVETGLITYLFIGYESFGPRWTAIAIESCDTLSRPQSIYSQWRRVGLVTFWLSVPDADSVQWLSDCIPEKIELI